MAIALDVPIRELVPADAPRVADLLAVAFAEEFEGAGTEYGAIVRQLRTGGWVQRRPWRGLAPLLGVEFRFFVAEQQGQIIGCAGMMGRRLPVINSVAVRPEHRRRGVAEALLAAVERAAILHGHDSVVLDVLADNTPARRLYEKTGYEEYHRFRTYTRTCRDAGQLDARRSDALHVLPAGYELVGSERAHLPRFYAIERASLPETYFRVAPSLAYRYAARPPVLIEWLLGGMRGQRRALLRYGQPAGFLAVSLVRGVREARVEFPLFPPEHTHALPAAIAGALAFARRGGAHTLRVDVSDTRGDQCAVLEALGFVHRWTFVQMVKRLTRGIRIPIRTTTI